MSLLTAGWLRRAALPLRAANPDLYSSLNQLRKRVLTRGRDLAGYQAVALDRFVKRVPLAGKSVLEIGCVRDMRLLKQFAARGAAHCVGLNNDAELFGGSSELQDGGLRLVFGDAAELPFPDRHFDALFSVATFEHILDLPCALREMHRVLRPGGIVYTNFGPIWSCGKGHHVRVQVGDQRAWHGDARLNPLPDFCHLLLAPSELRSALVGRVSPVLEQPIADWVYSDPGINRMFHHEYVREFMRSPLRVESMIPERDPLSPQLQRILTFKYPNEQAFDVTNTEVILVKDD
jgi:SAM-dependent methyltransferase